MGDKTPQFTSVTVVFGLTGFLLISILNFTDFIDWIAYFETEVLFIFVLLFFAFWEYVFYRKGKWKEIIKEFENESEKARKRGRILCVLAVLFTMLFFLSSLVVVYIRAQNP